MTLTISKVDFIGGVRAVVPEKRCFWWIMHSKGHWKMNTRNSGSGEV